MVTGKNKKQFEEWYFEHFKCMNPLVKPINQFYQLERFEMQLGVYLAYYDSLGMKVYTMGSISEKTEWSFSIWIDGDFEELIEKYDFKTRNEAYKEAFKQADKLSNQ